MTRENFEGICRTASIGKVKWVDNMEEHRAGRVVACSMEKLEVEFENKHATWSPESCRERTYGYKPVYSGGE